MQEFNAVPHIDCTKYTLRSRANHVGEFLRCFQCCFIRFKSLPQLYTFFAYFSTDILSGTCSILWKINRTHWLEI